MEETYLKYLQIYHASKDSSGSLFRSFVDNWYAYHRGPPFLNSKGSPKWFNNPHPQKEKEALLAMDFISKAALQVINGHQSDRLVKDHAVPIREIRTRFALLEQPSLTDIRQFLVATYKLGVITKTQDLMLNAAKLRSTMPKQSDWKARYNAIKIEEA